MIIMKIKLVQIARKTSILFALTCMVSFLLTGHMYNHADAQPAIEKKVILFNMQNKSDSGEHGYLSNILPLNIAKLLENTGSYIIANDKNTINIKDPEDDGYIQYMSNLKKKASEYSADYLVTGLYRIRKDTDKISIICHIYVARLEQIVKVFIVDRQLVVNLKDILDEISLKVQSEFIKFAKTDKQLFSKPVEIKTGQFSVSVNFGFMDVSGGWNNDFTAGSEKMFLFTCMYDLEKPGSKSGSLKNISLSLEFDTSQMAVKRADNFGSIAIEDRPPYHFSFMGFLAGGNYKIAMSDYLTINFNPSVGVVNTRLSADNDYDGFSNYFNPPHSIKSKTSLYMSAAVSLNVIMNPYSYLLLGLSYKYIQYSPEPIHAIIFSGGIGFRL
jgi:hypothetical protein